MKLYNIFGVSWITRPLKTPIANAQYKWLNASPYVASIANEPVKTRVHSHLMICARTQANAVTIFQHLLKPVTVSQIDYLPVVLKILVEGYYSSDPYDPTLNISEMMRKEFVSLCSRQLKIDKIL